MLSKCWVGYYLSEFFSFTTETGKYKLSCYHSIGSLHLVGFSLNNFKGEVTNIS